MRSTPWPKLILRTVKLACGPLLFEITTPSKACRRSLSPSLIFTWTRTVSPGRKPGRSVRLLLERSFSITKLLDILVPFCTCVARTFSSAQGGQECPPHTFIYFILVPLGGGSTRR